MLFQVDTLTAPALYTGGAPCMQPYAFCTPPNSTTTVNSFMDLVLREPLKPLPGAPALLNMRAAGSGVYNIALLPSTKVDTGDSLLDHAAASGA